MKRLKANQQHGCTYCKQVGEKRPAIWRQDGFHGLTACEKHRIQLEADEVRQRREDDHLSEADYQTWYRL